tara:strand:- start:552 stop:764 length:213 start_codon:yes stop_codon:yes gene_type:complete
MLLELEDIMDFSFLSFAFLISIFINKIHSLMDFITFSFVSDILSLGIQFFVLLGVIYKFKRIKDKKNASN